MPTYQFKCEVCDVSASVTIPLSENGDGKTPKCLECDVDMVRIFSAPAVSFKGSGWGSDR
jgi:putative FmdB family regulatory protein